MTTNSQLLANALPRISGKTGKLIDLNTIFYNNGVPTDPYWIKKIEIYKCSVEPANLMTVLPFSDKTDDLYPAPAIQSEIIEPESQCGTNPESSVVVPGSYHLPFMVPNDFLAPNVYIDIWYFFPENPCSGTDECDLSSSDYDQYLVKCCNRFFVYPDVWGCGDDLQSVNFDFEPLGNRFNSPEIKPLEIGLMPLPLYTYNKALVNQVLPMLKASITISTTNCETLVVDAPMSMGLRQGSFRSNPFVLRYNLDTSKFLRGSYQYQVSLKMPDGTTRVSKKYYFEIR